MYLVLASLSIAIDFVDEVFILNSTNEGLILEGEVDIDLLKSLLGELVSISFNLFGASFFGTQGNLDEHSLEGHLLNVFDVILNLLNIEPLQAGVVRVGQGDLWVQLSLKCELADVSILIESLLSHEVVRKCVKLSKRAG